VTLSERNLGMAGSSSGWALPRGSTVDSFTCQYRENTGWRLSPALPGLHGWIQQLPEPVYGAVLAATSRREVAAANAVYELGSPPDACYLIEAGRVRQCGGNQHQQCHRHRNDDRDHTDVPIGLFVGQLGNCEHGDYRAAVGE
jgi:hypothetical protein